jgi:hypothetical protein
MSFVERQIDFGSKSRILKEIKELKDEILRKGVEMDELRLRVERLERRCEGGSIEKIKIKGEKRRVDIDNIEDDNMVADKIMLIDNDEGCDVWNLLLIFDENSGKIFKMTTEQLERFCLRIMEMEMGEYLEFTDWEEDGLMCERDEDGDWVMRCDYKN